MPTEPKRTTRRESSHMQFYIDGTIDAITIVIDKEDKTLAFSLQPSSNFMKTVAEGDNLKTEVKKKALFIKNETPSLAHLRDVAKNESGKDIVFFTIESKDDSSLKCLLLEKKKTALLFAYLSIQLVAVLMWISPKPPVCKSCSPLSTNNSTRRQ